mgnify:CR=1 FL=1
MFALSFDELKKAIYLMYPIPEDAELNELRSKLCWEELRKMVKNRTADIA